MNRKLQLAAATAATALLTLTAGCGGDSATIDTGDGKVKVEKDGDGVKVESKDGTLESGTKLPSDFPKEIPLVEGEVVSATSVKTDGKQGFVVGLSTKASAEDVANEAVTEFEKAGFETLTKTVSGNSAFLGFKSDKWEVAVSVGSEGETTVSYIVSAVE